MSRAYVSLADQRWVMICDEPDCTTRSDARSSQQAHSLSEYTQKGWKIGIAFDACPACVAKKGGDKG